MSDAILFGRDVPNSADAQLALRRRIGWMCQLIRGAAVVYAVWVLYQIVRHWSDLTAVTRGYGAWLKTDLTGIENWQRLLGFGVHFVIWGLAAAGCYSVWRLFTGYLEGRIFTLDAALWLRRIGLFGLGAEIGDIVTRPLIALIVTAHLPAGQHQIGLTLNPNDLLNLLFLGGFVALAQVFATAAHIAAENEQIV